MRETLKNLIPGFLRRRLSDLRDRLAHEGKYDFKMKRDRASPLDYTTRYDHKNIRKAKKSILWDDDWEGATRATVAILRGFGLLGADRTIVDYGGGIGRISRAISEGSKSKVILVDRSPEMRSHALRYIPERLGEGSRLKIWSDTEFLDNIKGVSGGIDLILFIEALQHIPEPILDEILPKMIAGLSASGRIFVLGNKDLDVDGQGRRHHTLIGDFLKRRAEVLREDVWTKWERGGEVFSFKHPRYSFLCRRLS